MNELQESAGVTSPWTLMNALVEKGGDPDVLKKVAELVEHWEERQAKQAFVKAMNAAQAEMPRVIKTKQNQNKGLYAALEDVQDAVAPVIARHGFSLSWSQGESPDPAKTRVTATLFHTGGHSEKYQGDYAIDGTGAKGGGVMSAVQGAVSSHTYAQRDMLRLMWNITIAGQDKDGENGKAPLSGEQMALLNDVIEEMESMKKPLNLERFLGWVKTWATSTDGEEINSFHNVPGTAFVKILSELHRTRKKKAGAS
jgi:hypothetical protein